MRNFFKLVAGVALFVAVACSEPTGAGTQDTGDAVTDHGLTPSFAASWSAKYPSAPNCTNGNTLGVNELIIHGEVWEGFASNGWLQYAKSPLETLNPERRVEMEAYSYQGSPAVRCRNTTKVLIWTFYDSPSQTPTHHTINNVNSTWQTVEFSPSAFTSIGDGNEILTGSGLWEIGRDHWVIKAYPRQLSSGATVLDTLVDTLAVDVMIQYPAPIPGLGGGCPPNMLDVPQCRP